ncbi:HAD superfamily hydrolase [Schizosaccharomyces osmophilus]|uniref:HAD superfamily hydrolase n=1 Tax=Schizosaccharomyces osmophilus TaxID=2545709 RepID=A0AAF0AW16_9SCHI|nr:HAD superfamily hydrolase [Schizosaccharomyces osmophilus]WBW73023.1 HAD superfamily hydrolase [Schizosaccharomyces osmophilus]
MLFVVDFDETITAHDTISCLAKAANKPGVWDFLAKSYWEEYMAWQSGLPKLTTLCSHLDLLQTGGFAETASIQRVQSHKFFEGLSLEQLDAVASSITLRDGFDKFLQLLMPRLRDGSDEFHILSINWSSRVIESTLRRIPGIDLRLVTIHSNDLELDPATQLTTGNIVPFHAQSLIMTADDKMHEFLVIIQKASPSSQSNATVYIGDSSTDFGCFFHATIGILFLANERSRSTLESFSDVTLLKLDPSIPKFSLNETSQLNRFPQSQTQPYKAQNPSNSTIYTCDQWTTLTKVFQR